MLAGALDPLADDAADGFIEHQLHIGGLFGAGFGESHSSAVGELLSLQRLHLPVLIHVKFVPHKVHNDFRRV